MIHEEDAQPWEEDRGFLYGDALFETVRVRHGALVWGERHRARLERSGEWLGLDPARVAEGWRMLEAAARERDGLWRLTISHHAPAARFGGVGHVALRWREVSPSPSPALGLVPASYFPGDRVAEHKTTGYLRSIMAKDVAILNGYDDAVRLSPEGRVGMASSANLFFWLEDRWVTPAVDGVLPGVTREVALEALRARGMAVDERAVWAEELEQCEEIVLTSAGVGAASAASLEGRGLGRARGDVLRELLIERGWIA